MPIVTQRKSLTRRFLWETGCWWQDFLDFSLMGKNSQLHEICHSTTTSFLIISPPSIISFFHPFGINHIDRLKCICRVFINSDLGLKSNRYSWLEYIRYLLSIIGSILSLKVKLRIRTFEQFHTPRICSCQPSVPHSEGRGDMRKETDWRVLFLLFQSGMFITTCCKYQVNTSENLSVIGKQWHAECRKWHGSL